MLFVDNFLPTYFTFFVYAICVFFSKSNICLKKNVFQNCFCLGPTVTSAPNIHLISEKTVLEGTHDLEIACYAEGIPTPVVSWDEIDVCRFIYDKKSIN